MAQLGLYAAPDKCQGPTTIIIWIGVVFDTIRLTAIDPSKVEEARLFCLKLLATGSIPVKKCQKFLGKLFHHQVYHGSQDLLQPAFGRHRHRACRHHLPDARADIHWFIKPSVAQHVIHVYSCLQGGGGLCSGPEYYKILYLDYLQAISSLECWNLLVAALTGTTVFVFCDNWATVAAINSGRATDPLIRGSLRELCWIASSHDVQLEVRHKPGAEMLAADTLSRAAISSTAATKFAQFAI